MDYLKPPHAQTTADGASERPAGNGWIVVTPAAIYEAKTRKEHPRQPGEGEA